MISRVADNMTIQGNNASLTTVRSDPVALGDYNLARATLVVHQIAPPASNVAEIKVYEEYSNDGIHWSTIATALTSSTVGGGTVMLPDAYKPECAYVRYKFEFNPAETGSDTGTGFVVFDFVVRYSNQ